MNDREKEETKIRNTYKVEGISATDLSMAMLLLFLLLWLNGAWYRIDCAVGVVAGCEAIALEYKGKPRP